MPMRNLLWAVVLLGWAAGIAWGADNPNDRTQYSAILLDGGKIGYALTRRQVKDAVVTTTVKLRMRMRRGPIELLTESTTVTEETVDGKPLRFESTDKMGSQVTVTQGAIADGQCEYTVSSGVGNVQKRTMPWPPEALLPEGMRLLTRAKGLKQGAKYPARAFTPSLLSAPEQEIAVGPRENVDLLGRVVPLTRLTTTINTEVGKITVVSFVDAEGNELKGVMPVMGMKVETVACDRRYALSADNPPDFLAKFLLACPAPLTADQRAGGIVYRIQPTGRADLKIASDDAQSVAPTPQGQLAVTVRPTAAPAGAKMPYAGTDPAALEALKPSVCVESDNAKIIAAARRAIGQTTDAAEAARKLEAFVGTYIRKKDLSIGYATAAEVLETRQGDCTEHAVLLAAMCKAVGIPAQVVDGVAYVEGWAGRKQVFAPHAWVRVFIDGRWVHLDAAIGYDAGHIMLSAGNGDPESFFGLVGMFGCFTVTEARPANAAPAQR